MIPKLHIIRTPDGVDFNLPAYASRHHAGLVLQAAVPSVLKLDSGERALVSVGFGIGIPDGLCGQIVSLPSVAKEKGLIVLDAPQIVNPADRDSLFVLVQNASRRQLILRRGDNIAQLVVMPVYQVCWNEITGKMLQDSTSNSVLDKAENTAGADYSLSQVSLKRTVKSVRERAKPGHD